jgi:hypothetical protein
MAVVYVKDRNTFEFIRIEENYSSLVWTERYQAPGDFVMEIPISEANFDVYRRGNYVIMDESEEVMVIETLNINDEVEDPVLEVSGRSITCFLERRLNASRLLENYASDIEYVGELGDVISQMVADEITEPFMEIYVWVHNKWYEDRETDVPSDGTLISTGTVNGRNYYVAYGYGPKCNPWSCETGYELVWKREKQKLKINTDYRKIKGFKYENKCPEIQVSKQYGQIMTLLDLITSFAKAYVFGFRIILGENNEILLQTYKGSDRTSNQKTLDPVIFNPVMDNITYVNYFEDQTDYRNMALAYSDGNWSPVDFNAVFVPYIFSGYCWVDDQGNYRPMVAENNLDLEALSKEYGSGNFVQKTDLDRMELAVDARSSAKVSDYDPSGILYPEYGEAGDTEGAPSGDSSIDTSDEGIPALKQLARTVANVATDEFNTGDHDFIKTSEGSIDPLVRYKFEEDYFLGDIVELSNNNGVIMTAIIDEVVKSYDADGYIVTPNFKNMTEYDYGDDEDADGSEEGEEETA